MNINNSFKMLPSFVKNSQIGDAKSVEHNEELTAFSMALFNTASSYFHLDEKIAKLLMLRSYKYVINFFNSSFFD